jgi:hypothetical protein
VFFAAGRTGGLFSHIQPREFVRGIPSLLKTIEELRRELSLVGAGFSFGRSHGSSRRDDREEKGDCEDGIAE